MKKIIVCLMALVLAVMLPVTAFAAGAFLSSPSNNAGTELIDYEFSDGCDATLIITPYDERDTLGEDARNLLEEAYDQIANNKNLGDLVEGLKEMAEKAGIDVSTLAVSDLFNIGYEGCDDHGDHSYTVKLKPEILNNFFTVMQYVDGKWIIVENATVSGGYLTMTSKYYGPVAIVVEAGNTQTGDSFPWIYLVLMAVSAAGLVAVSVMYNKKTA